MMGKKGALVALQIPGVKHPVYVRAHTSDEYIFRTIFVEDQYALDLAEHPSTIVDAGANIGLAAVYFANKYPGAGIVCVEPEPGNYALLEKNTAPYGNISLLQKAVWSKASSIRIEDIGFDNWGFVVKEVDNDTPGSIAALSIQDILKTREVQHPTLIKVDIEGSEREVFAAPDVHEWLNGCDVLIVEIHDRLQQGASRAVFEALLKYDFSYDQKADHIICNLKGQRQ